MKKILLCLLAAFALVGSAAAEQVEKKTTVYVFCVAQSFADSVCYLSAVQPLEGATLDAKGFLEDRAAYSASFAQYVQQKYGQPSTMSCLLFDKSRKAAEREYIKIRAKYLRRSGTLVKEVAPADFTLKARTYDYNN